MKRKYYFFIILLCLGSGIYGKSDGEKDCPKLLLYYLPWCPYSQKVLSYLQSIHKSVPVKNLQKDPEGREELRRIGGKTQVPCLLIENYPLYESDAIIEWLSDNKECLFSPEELLPR